MKKKSLSLFVFLLCMSLVGCNFSAMGETNPTPSTLTETFFTEPTNTQTNITIAPTFPEPTDATVPVTEEPTEPPPTESTCVTAVEWTPICQNYIGLWDAPGSSTAITTIPLGDTVQLTKWYGKYALVTYKGMQGYVYSNYIRPANVDYFAQELKVMQTGPLYTYQQMLSDMEQLQALYPGLVRISEIGTSELGKKIPVMLVGDPDAKYHVLLQGAIHGREHFTAWLAMAMADHALLYGQIADTVCYHIIPMSNPDGVAISQNESLNETQKNIYQNDLSAGYTASGIANYAKQWKSNALGVDLNRNFSSGWTASLERPVPSSEKYRGTEPFSAAEAQALRDYTLTHDLDVTISLHSHGSVIYYQYGSKQPVNRLSYSLAQAVEKTTGYIPTSFDNTTGAGYKDWAMDELGIPSLTLEIGNSTTPLEERDIYNTFARCQNLLPTIFDWLTQNS